MLLFRSRTVKKKYTKLKKKAASCRRFRFLSKLNRNFDVCKQFDRSKILSVPYFRPLSVCFYGLRSLGCFVKSTFIFKHPFLNLRKVLPSAISLYVMLKIWTHLNTFLQSQVYFFTLILPLQYKFKFLEFISTNCYVVRNLKFDFFSLNTTLTFCRLSFEYFTDYLGFLLFVFEYILISEFEIPLVFLNLCTPKSSHSFEIYWYLISFCNVFLYSPEDLVIEDYSSCPEIYEEDQLKLQGHLDLVNSPSYQEHPSKRLQAKLFFEYYNPKNPVDADTFYFLDRYEIMNTLFLCRQHAQVLVSYFFLLSK